MSAKWKEATMREALLYAKARIIDINPIKVIHPYDFLDATVEMFTDGTAVACRSSYGSSDSDTWSNEPEWYIYSKGAEQ